MAAKIRKGDTVAVLTGRDKGKRGEVLSVNPEEGRALVRGMDIQFVTTAKTDKEAKALLKAFDLPFTN